MTPTLRTLTRNVSRLREASRALAALLAPWWIIQRLCSENRRLRRSNDRLADMVFFACSRNVASDRRLRKCPTHGQQPPNAWGCPECVQELRGELATAREAMRRLMTHLMLRFDFDDVTFVGVYRWYQGGMTGPLPPLPDHIAKRDDQPTTEDL